MNMRFLGTGAAELYPNPYCDCEVCERARRAKEIRLRSAFLLNEHNMVDFGVDVLAASALYDIPLYAIENVFITHTHPDHFCLDNIGAATMAHGDNNGLVLPPKIAPIQVIVLPIAQHKPGVLEKAQELVDRLAKLGLRVKGDFTDNSPGWKFANWEMKGVPLRIEIGPKDIENNQCVAVRRDDREKLFLSLDELDTKVPELLDAVQKSLYEKAKANMEEHTYPAYSLEEAKKIQEEKGGFIKTMWCGELACEMKMKEQAGMSSRCMPLHQEHLADTCPICGKPAKHMIYWGVAY